MLSAETKKEAKVLVLFVAQSFCRVRLTFERRVQGVPNVPKIVQSQYAHESVPAAHYSTIYHCFIDWSQVYSRRLHPIDTSAAISRPQVGNTRSYLGCCFFWVHTTFRGSSWDVLTAQICPSQSKFSSFVSPGDLNRSNEFGASQRLAEFQ